MQAYSRHDALLFPSLHDSSGNVVLEAMSRGLPVVCLAAGGPAVLVDAASGFRVAPGEPSEVVDALGAALAKLAGDAVLARAMSEAAVRRAQRDFSWTRQIARMEAYYRLACEAADPARGAAA